jgi:hypothetical protein
MYSVPDFSSPGPARSGDPIFKQMDSGSLGGMSSTQNQYANYPAMTAPPDGGMPQMSGGGASLGPLTPSGGTPLGTPPGAGSATPPGIVPPAVSTSPIPGTNQNPGDTTTAGIGARLPGNVYQSRTQDPAFTSQFDAWLKSMMGTGATPFDLSAILPSTGATTAPGTLTAPDNPILKALQEFYTKGTGGPLPGVLPMWQSAMKSMEIPIQKQLANIKEQFGARGALGSSEMAQSMETFGAQTAADQEALLGQLTLQALPGMEAAGMDQQSLDQKSIDNLVQEFIRTRPEYSPLLGEEFGLATMYPPTYNNAKGTFGTAFLGSLGKGVGEGLSGVAFGGG